MRKVLLGLALAVGLTTQAFADFRIITPQNPPQDWMESLVPLWKQKLGENILIDYQPGAWNLPGLNKFQASDRLDNNVIAEIINSAAEAYLTQKAGTYNFHDWSLVGLQQYTNWVEIHAGFDPYNSHIKISHKMGAGSNADAMAIALLVCGPKKTKEEYKTCFDEKVTYIKGMPDPDSGVAFNNGELDATSGGLANWFVKWKLEEGKGKFTTWFIHDLLDMKTGKDEAQNILGVPTVNQLYKKKWGVEPSGEFYDAYRLVRTYRDVLQKSVWVNKGNPNLERLQKAWRAVLSDPETRAKLEERNGALPIFIGEKEASVAFKTLESITTEKAYKDLIWIEINMLGMPDSVYKPELVKK